jgi:hypothetical protein
VSQHFIASAHTSLIQLAFHYSGLLQKFLHTFGAVIPALIYTVPFNSIWQVMDHKGT